MRFATLALLAACTGSAQRAGREPAPEHPRETVEGPSTTGPELGLRPEPEPDPGLTDRALGTLVRDLSESTGDFPSENLVSNETSYLMVAAALREEALVGRGYVGVGPEQNLTYVALLRPRIAYVVDIRRENLWLHLVLRAAIEAAENRAAFLAGLTARPPPALSADASIDSICDALSEAEASEARREAATRRTLALAERLGLSVGDADRETVRHIHEAFSEHGVSLAFSMEGARRRYPPLRDQLAARDPAGRRASFVADEETYGRVRDLLRDNRLVPVVGDFAGPHALRAIATDMQARGLTLGALYASNVEEYLFRGRSFERFVENLRAFPIDDRSLILRVWLDRGTAHPLQMEGHRTTTVATPLAAFLARHEERPFRSYWELVRFREEGASVAP